MKKKKRLLAPVLISYLLFFIVTDNPLYVCNFYFNMTYSILQGYLLFPESIGFYGLNIKYVNVV